MQVQHQDPQSISNTADTNRIRQLTAAFAAFRRTNKPGRRIPLGLRNQVVAALNAGVSAGTLQKACRLSWSQVTRWRSAVHAGGALASLPQADVLSVVETATAAPVSSLDNDVVVRVGPWRFSISRVAN